MNFIKKNIILILILVFAVFLRLHDVEGNPPSINWDEASMGYNAYSIFKTGADEYGNILPLSIRSFDVYQLPLYVYSDVPIVGLLGLSEFSTRLPAAIYGILTVLTTYYLVKEIFSNREKEEREKIALVATFFMAVSPWHLQFSRGAFEAMVGLFFFVLGTAFFLKALKKEVFFIFAALSFIATLYSYHSFRLLTPLFLIFLVTLFFKEIKNLLISKNNISQRKYLIISFILLALFSLPIIHNLTLNKNAGARLSMVTIFGESDALSKSIERLEYDRANGNIFGEIFENRRFAYFQMIAKGYLDHFNPDFLFLHGDGGKHHHAVDFGMLYLWELPFIFIGIVLIFRKFDKRIALLFGWLLISPIASAITSGTPHPLRAIIMIPPLHILTAYGVYQVLFNINLKKNILITIQILVVISFLINFFYYIHQYYVHTPREYGYFWQYGNKEAIQFAKEEENNYDRIIMSYEYDQPYIYYLFYNKIDPSWYQKNWNYSGTGVVDRFYRKIGKYEFRDINLDQDKNLKNTLLIGTPNEISEGENVIKEIYFPDGSIAYRIYTTK